MSDFVQICNSKQVRCHSSASDSSHRKLWQNCSALSLGDFNPAIAAATCVDEDLRVGVNMLSCMIQILSYEKREWRPGLPYEYAFFLIKFCSLMLCWSRMSSYARQKYIGTV